MENSKFVPQITWNSSAITYLDNAALFRRNFSLIRSEGISHVLNIRMQPLITSNRWIVLAASTAFPFVFRHRDEQDRWLNRRSAGKNVLACPRRKCLFSIYSFGYVLFPDKNLETFFLVAFEDYVSYVVKFWHLSSGLCETTSSKALQLMDYSNFMFASRGQILAHFHVNVILYSCMSNGRSRTVSIWVNISSQETQKICNPSMPRLPLQRSVYDPRLTNGMSRE